MCSLLCQIHRNLLSTGLRNILGSAILLYRPVIVVGSKWKSRNLIVTTDIDVGSHYLIVFTSDLVSPQPLRTQRHTIVAACRKKLNQAITHNPLSLLEKRPCLNTTPVGWHTNTATHSILAEFWVCSNWKNKRKMVVDWRHRCAFAYHHSSFCFGVSHLLSYHIHVKIN